MLLRRYTKHIADQNWIAVIIDFLVVVLGIFIGLQVTDWNQARKDHNQGIYYVSFLHNYLEESAELEANRIKTSADYLNNTWEANKLMFKNSWTNEDKSKFEELRSSTSRMWGKEQKPVALRQLVDGGKLDLITSKEIQLSILEYESKYVEAIRQTRVSYSFSLPITLQITNNVRYRGRSIISTSEELLGNQALISAIRDKFIWQRVQLDVLKDIQKANKELSAILKTYLAANK